MDAPEDQDYINLLPPQCLSQILRLAYIAWVTHFGPQYTPYVKRTVKAWNNIKGWLTVHHPPVLSSLQAGLTEEELHREETKLKLPLPVSLATIYRLHNGQSLEYDTSRSEDSKSSFFYGMFGGYAFYDHVVCVRMLPLDAAVVWTGRFQNRLPADRRTLIFAANFNFQKMFIVDLESGEVLVNKAPQEPLQFVLAAPADSNGLPDGCLRWFEEYSRRLDTHVYETSLLDDEVAYSSAICLFPLQPPHLISEVTRGVQVRVTTIYVPEQSQHKHLFTYSVRFSLLSVEAQKRAAAAAAAVASGPMASHYQHIIHSAQLLSRHWVVRDETGEVTGDTRGEAVIGKYPLLLPGGPEFVYQSCTYQRADLGSMEGDFRFVEGTIEHPTGAEWDVVCPQFRLDVPEYIF